MFGYFLNVVDALPMDPGLFNSFTCSGAKEAWCWSKLAAFLPFAEILDLFHFISSWLSIVMAITVMDNLLNFDATILAS